ncbi:MAG: MATE family efflux transporter [Thermoplasmatales archaeon]|nr:MAG: MATE family efflux transporter [Thermoplasmatales archaeon]
MIVAMSVHTIYNLADAIWVSGLGTDALAAVGFVYPFFFTAMALSTGLGMGGGSAISRRIGAKDKKGADNVAVHTIMIMILASVVFSIPLFIFARDIFVLIGAAGTTGMATVYARIIFAGSIITFFSFIANAILRAEGDAKRAMYAMLLGAGLNIILDPIFIYTLKLGVAGAAWATLLSLSISSIILAYWLFFKKSTYVSFVFRGFKFNKNIIKDILKVGLPASILQLSMSFTMLIITIIIAKVTGSTDGVAVYTAGWRIATIAILPLLGIATAVVSVTGAAYGARKIDKLNMALMYAIKIGLIIEIIMAISTFVLAPFITVVFTQAEDTARIAEDLTTFLRIVCLYYPGVAFGMLSSSLFQGTGKGINALMVTIFRTLILTVPLALIFSTIFQLGLVGIWMGIVAGNVTGSLTAFTWAKIYIHKLRILQVPSEG